MDAPGWNEQHNSTIDLRAHLPVRRAALALGRALRLAHADDAFYLLEGELLDLAAAGEGARLDRARALTHDRRRFTEESRARRRTLPATWGDLAGRADDVVLRQALGVPDVGTGLGGSALITGLGVSPGRARGRARLCRHPDDTVLLRAGEVLVCEATPPSWTPAFARIAAAVCASGGLLTHAAIVSGEYGLPCVCAAVGATERIQDGDLVEVDGTTGTVRVLRGGIQHG